MKFKLLLLGSALLCSGLFAVNGAFAQGCRAELISGHDGGIVDMFTGSECRKVRKRCKRKLRKLRYQDPYFYQYAYCDVFNIPHYVSPSPYPIPYSQPRSYVSPRPHLTPRFQPRTYVSPSPRLVPRSQPRSYVSPRSQPRSYVSPNPRSIPQPQPRSYVTRSYDRCQAPGVVRCTQEWSDGRIVTEDYSCSGCRGYGNPAGDPCGWSCSFPQQ